MAPKIVFDQLTKSQQTGKSTARQPLINVPPGHPLFGLRVGHRYQGGPKCAEHNNLINRCGRCKDKRTAEAVQKEREKAQRDRAQQEQSSSSSTAGFSTAPGE